MVAPKIRHFEVEVTARLEATCGNLRCRLTELHMARYETTRVTCNRQFADSVTHKNGPLPL